VAQRSEATVLGEGQPDRTAQPGRAAARLVGSDRVLAVLKELATHPEGVTLDDLARAVDSPKSTVHRALGALRRSGFAHQDGHGRYSLGDEYLRLAFAHHEARPDHERVRPVLHQLAQRFGETAHYGVLDNRSIVYRAKVDPPGGPVRLTSTVGGRNPAHSTAIGQLLLASTLPDLDAVRTWVAQAPLEQLTPRTVVEPAALHERFVAIRVCGYAVDDQANEPWVNCLAVPVSLFPGATPAGAISISALAYRTPLQVLVDALPEIRAMVGPLSPRGAA
jgi:IclR family transcriptional regulator, acetate operon repressor